MPDLIINNEIHHFPDHSPHYPYEWVRRLSTPALQSLTLDLQDLIWEIKHIQRARFDYASGQEANEHLRNRPRSHQ